MNNNSNNTNNSNNNPVMNNNNNPTRLVCPKCGAEFALPESTITAIATIIGRDLNLGVIHPTVIGQYEGGVPTPSPSATVPAASPAGSVPVHPTKAQQRIDALAAAGHDVSSYFAINRGSDTVIGHLVDGKMQELDPDAAEILAAIAHRGTLYDKHLFKQHVMGQMFRMMTNAYPVKAADGSYEYKVIGYPNAVRRLGYMYMFSMLNDEFRRQKAMWQHGDKHNFEFCNLFFNKELAVYLAHRYVRDLRKYIANIPVKHCKKRAYKYIDGAQHLQRGWYRGTFCNEIDATIFKPLDLSLTYLDAVDTPVGLHHAWEEFCKHLVNIPSVYKYTTKDDNRKVTKTLEFHQPQMWQEAYKGYGSYWTLQNLIEFHGIKIQHAGMSHRVYTGAEAMAYLNSRAKANSGSWLYGMLVHALAFNNIDPAAKRAEWRAQYESRRK